MRSSDLDVRQLLSKPPVPCGGFSPELMQRVEQRIQMDDMNPRNSRARWGKRSAFTAGAAVVAAVAMVAGGMFAFSSRSANGLAPTTTGTTEKGTGLQFSGPAEVVTQYWRVVIAKTLLKPGPYYDIQMFWIGKMPIEKSGVVFDWGGSKTSGEGAPLQPGDECGGVVGGYFPHGFTASPPIKVSWVQNGQNISESISIQDAKQDMEIQGYHEYHGEGKNWSVSYAYETIVGKDFRKPVGQLELTSKQTRMGDSVQFTLQSPGGAATMTYDNPQGHALQTTVDPTENGYRLTDPNAKVSIQWAGGTDTFDIHASMPS